MRLDSSGTRMWIPVATAAIAVIALAGCGCDGGGGGAPAGARTVPEIMEARELSEADAVGAISTYTPGGRFDEFYMFSSGGHSGQVIVVGIPSMRILKYIGVFTPEPWQGFGFDDSRRGYQGGGGTGHL